MNFNKDIMGVVYVPESETYQIVDQKTGCLCTKENFQSEEEARERIASTDWNLVSYMAWLMCNLFMNSHIMNDHEKLSTKEQMEEINNGTKC